VAVQSLFITGTDTGVGKTYVACQLIRRYVEQGYKVVGMKPVAAGCELVDGRWVNEDVALLTEASNVKAPPHLINPYCFNPPIAPHIAAEQAGIEIQFEVIKAAYAQLALMADVVIVEGAGGLLVPLYGQKTIADLIQYLDIPVTLVVGLKLGCINHTALSLALIKQRELALKEVVVNQLDKKLLCVDENIESIRNLLNGNEYITFLHVL
jgi:dethiobiotin synthetase